MRFGQKIILIVYSLFFILLSIFFVPYNTTQWSHSNTSGGLSDEGFEAFKAERIKPKPVSERIVFIHYRSIWYEHVNQINSTIWLMEIVTLSIVMGVAFVLIGQNKRNG